MSANTPDKPIMQLVSQILDKASTDDGISYDTLINILSLICLISILTRGAAQPAHIANTSTSANPLQNILGALTKGDGSSGGGPSPEMLMSLLPLLNNPQIKAKLNPANIAAIMGLVNNLGGTSADKHESTKQEKPVKADQKSDVSPAAAVTSSAEAATDPIQSNQQNDLDDGDKKGLGRYLNWKTNF